MFQYPFEMISVLRIQSPKKWDFKTWLIEGYYSKGLLTELFKWVFNTTTLQRSEI